MSAARKSYPSDVADEEWEYLLPYLMLLLAAAAILIVRYSKVPLRTVRP